MERLILGAEVACDKMEEDQYLEPKSIGSSHFMIFVLKENCLKKIYRKNYKNHLRSNNYEVCTAVALCFPNILDIMVLQDINLSSDRNGATVIVV
jgi:hypothetical protein